MPACGSMNRRRMLQGSAALAAAGTLPRIGQARGLDAGLRREVLKTPGVGARPPTYPDWRRVGELCLGGTRETVRAGEFGAVELTFLGLAGPSAHNAMFRGFLDPWERHTGARVRWIDLTRPEYEARLQRTFGGAALDFDLLEMSALDEGELLGGGMASAVPEWVRDLIEVEDYVASLRDPVGSWNGTAYRVSIDADCHVFNFRTDYFESEALARAWRSEGHQGTWEVPATWDRVAEVSAFLAGRTGPDGRAAYGHLEPLKGWGGFGFPFLAGRAAAYAKRPGDPVYLFDPDTMSPLVNTPPWVRAIGDVMEMRPFLPPGQTRADPGTTAFQQFLAGTGAMLAWWGDVGDCARTLPIGEVTGFGILPGATEVWNRATGAWERPHRPNFAPSTAGIGAGLYVTARVEGDPVRKKAAWSAAAHLGGRDLSLWTSCYPSGLQPYRNSHFITEEWVAAGHERAFIARYLASHADTLNHPNAAVEPRIPGLRRYYAAAEDELARIYSGAHRSPQHGADAIASSWDRITDGIGRDRQKRLYRESLGL